MTVLRADLATVLRRVRDGEDVVVTDRGVPVARLSPVDAAPLLERLTRDGVLGPAAGPRPVLSGRDRVRVTGSVSDLVGELRTR